MAKVEKSFTTLGLADGILDGVVSCLIEAEKTAKSSREIQTLDVSRRGLRQDIYVGKVMVVPHQIMDDTSKIPDMLLKGAVLRLFDGEEAACLEAHRLSTNDFDDLSDKDLADYKDKVFRDDTAKLGCVVIFQPAWGNFRDLHAFRFTKDVPKLTLMVRHLVFSAYYNPSLSALFETLTEDGIKLDADNITHEHLGPAYEFKGDEQSYPVLDKGDEKIAKKGGLKKRAENIEADDKDASVMKLSFDEVVNGYLECALWTGTEGDEGTPLDSKYDTRDFSPAAVQKAEDDCMAFVDMAGDELDAIDLARAGHLFWLNRNGHGTGFWDEDQLDEAAREKLDKLAHSFGECDLYVNDDGELEFEGGHTPAPPPPPGGGHTLPVQASKLRLCAANLTKVAAEKIRPEESAVMDQLEIQLTKKVLGSANFKKGANTGDAGSVRIPTDPKSGARSQEDPDVPEVEKVGGHVYTNPDGTPRSRGGETSEGTVKDNLAPRNDFRVTFEDGNSLVTGFNGTLQDAENYYLKNVFTVAHKRVRGVKVEQLNDKTAASYDTGNEWEIAHHLLHGDPRFEELADEAGSVEAMKEAVKQEWPESKLVPACAANGHPIDYTKFLDAVEKVLQVYGFYGLAHPDEEPDTEFVSKASVTAAVTEGSTGLRSQPDYGESDSYTAEANDENASENPSRAKLSHNEYPAEYDMDYPCEICGQMEEECVCPPCPVCDEQGNPDCYEQHGLVLTPTQEATLAQQEQIWKDEADRMSEPPEQLTPEQDAQLQKLLRYGSKLVKKLTASNEDLHNGYTEMREVIKSDFAGDTRDKESDHGKTASAIPPVSPVVPGKDPAAQKKSPAVKTLKDKQVQEYKHDDKSDIGTQIDKYAADQAISSAANRLVEQHCGEYFTKDSLKHLLRNATSDIKAVFNFMTQQGLIIPYGDQYKIQTRQHGQDVPKTSMWAEEEEDMIEHPCSACGGPGTELGVLGSRKHYRCRNCGMDYSVKIASAKAKASRAYLVPTRVLQQHYPELFSKTALTYMHPGQVSEQFAPDILKDISNYPMGYAERNQSPPPLPLELRDNPDNAQVTTDDYSDKGMKHPQTLPGLVPSQDNNSVPLKPNEKSIRGPFFSDQFYRVHTDISPALLTMKSSLKTAAAPEKAEAIAQFLRKLAGEIASSLLAAFAATDRPLFTSTAAYSSINLMDSTSFLPMNPLLTTGGMNPYVSEFKALLEAVNDGELTGAINNAWAQSAVWHDSEDGRFLYEVFVRIEKVDLDTLEITYKYVTGTKE